MGIGIDVRATPGGETKKLPIYSRRAARGEPPGSAEKRRRPPRALWLLSRSIRGTNATDTYSAWARSATATRQGARVAQSMKSDNQGYWKSPSERTLDEPRQVAAIPDVTAELFVISSWAYTELVSESLRKPVCPSQKATTAPPG